LPHNLRGSFRSSAAAQEALKAARPADAIVEFSAILAIDPQNLDARANLGRSPSILRATTAKATRICRRLLLKLGKRGQSDLVKLRALLGMAEKRTGKMRPLPATWNKAFPLLTEQKLKVEAGMELIELYYARSDLPKAAEVANVLRQLKPDDPDILYAAHRIFSELADETTLALAMARPILPH